MKHTPNKKFVLIFTCVEMKLKYLKSVFTVDRHKASKG